MKLRSMGPCGSKMFMRGGMGVAVLIALAGVGGRARAAGVALDQLTPAERGSDWFVTDSLDLRGHLRPAIGLDLSWANRPLVVWDSAGQIKTNVVSNQFVAYLGGSLVIWDRLRLSLMLPIDVYANGNGAIVDGVIYAAPKGSPVLGDLRASAYARVFGHYGGLLTGAVGASLELPTGDNSAYAGTGEVAGTLHLAIAGDFAPIAYAAKIDTTLRRGDYFDGVNLGSETVGAVSVGVRALDRRLLIGPEFYGRTTLVSGGFFDEKTSPFEGILGAHYMATEAWKIGAGAGFGFDQGLGAPRSRVILSVEWAPPFEIPDRDHDGIPDAVDACPDVAGVHTDSPDTNGCPPPPPPPPPDRDHDGIIDRLDACPDVAGKPSSDPKRNGCPDTDSDGIIDSLDACPTVSGVASDDPAKNGCPPDADNDGIPDGVDACPQVAGVADPDPKRNGCPPDRDGDGIPDAEDACPRESGPKTDDPKTNGCPTLVRVTEGEIVILNQVHFDTNKATIATDSSDLLTQVAQVFHEHPEIQHLLVEGHTDAKGSAKRNLKLSQARAQAVVQWLVDHGVETQRLSAQGFGQTRPIGDNKTADGRARNRRVAFRIQAQ